MKKIILLCVSILLFVSGCSTATPTHRDEFTAIPIKDSPWVAVKIEKNYEGVSLKLENKTEEVLEIDWNSSSLDGSNLFLDGQKYIDAGKMIPNQAIAPFASIQRSVYKANSVYYSSYYKSWQIDGDVNYPSKIVIKIINGNKSNFIVFDLNNKKIPLTINKQ